MSLLVVLAFASGSAGTAQAQSIDQLIQQQRQILQQQEDRRRQQLEQLRRDRAPEDEGVQRDEGPQAEPKRCVPVEKIVFDGAELLQSDTKVALRKPFIGKCMSVVDIMAVVRVVTNWYIEKGYVTTRVYPPQQDLSKGVLTIKVLEGRTESLHIYENGKKRRGANTAFPVIVGKRLYIRDIEQGLDQINRLPTHDAKIRIEQGTKDGYSKVHVDTATSSLPHIAALLDNNGLSTTGELQASATVYAGDVLGLYDNWILTYKTSEPFYEGQKASREFTASASIPWGYWTLLMSGSYFDYKSELVGELQRFDTDGVSKYYTVELQRVIHRDRDSKTRLSGFGNFKDIENFVDDIELLTGSRKLNELGVRLSHSHNLWGGLLDASVSGHWGVPMFGSLTDDESLDGSPTAEYGKISGDIRYYRPFKLGSLALAWNAKAAGQWSNDDLFSTEQISLGSLYTVRGFKDQSLSGDTGGYVRNELIWTVPQFLPENTRPVFGRMDLFTAFDAGWLKPDDEDEFEQGSVAGLSAGARLTGGYLFGEVAYEKPLHAPDFIRKDELFRFQGGLSVKW